MTKLRTFQKQFINAVENPRYGTVAISGPRSLGNDVHRGPCPHQVPDAGRCAPPAGERIGNYIPV